MNRLHWRFNGFRNIDDYLGIMNYSNCSIFRMDDIRIKRNDLIYTKLG